MELSELYNIIKSEMLEAGLKRRTSCCKETDQSMWVFGDELKTGDVGLCGNMIYVQKVYRSNGTTNDVSYKLCIMKVNNSSANDLYKLKISSKRTEKTLRKAIKSFIELYKETIK